MTPQNGHFLEMFFHSSPSLLLLVEDLAGIISSRTSSYFIFRKYDLSLVWSVYFEYLLFFSVACKYIVYLFSYVDRLISSLVWLIQPHGAAVINFYTKISTLAAGPALSQRS